MSLSTLGRAALRYAEEGFPVFPLAPKSKVPVFPSAHPEGDPLRGVCKGGCGKVGHGHLDATTDAAKITDWWTQHPQANIAVRPPVGLIVLDFDTIEAYQRTLAQILKYPLPKTAEQHTSRGVHLWFKVGVPVKQGPILPDIEVRTHDGSATVAPSVHASGFKYRWERPPVQGIADAPDWLVELCRADRVQSYSDGPREKLVERVFSGLQRGERNRTLYEYACRLRGLGVDRMEAELLLLAAAKKGDTVDLPEYELRTILGSAWKFAPEAAKKEAEKAVVVSMDDPDLMEVEDLLAAEFPPVRWLIPSLVSDGLTVLAASPKIGKSWVCFDLALSVSAGQDVLGTYPTEQGRVLYLDLEQPRRKAQDRILKISTDTFGTTRTPKGGWRGVTFARNWPRLDEGGLEKLDAYLTQRPDCRLVVVDVLSKITPGTRKGGNVYDEEYRLYSALKKVFDDHRVAGVCIHHDRKSSDGDQVDRVSGSRALVGAADTILVMSRRREEDTGLLFATGREIEDRVMEIRWDPVTFRWLVSDPNFSCPHERTRRERGGVTVCVKCGEVLDQERSTATDRKRPDPSASLIGEDGFVA